MARGYLDEEVPREKKTPGERKKRSKKTDWLSMRFVGVDGEGMDVWETKTPVEGQHGASHLHVPVRKRRTWGGRRPLLEPGRPHP